LFNSTVEEFERTGVIPKAKSIGRPKKFTDENIRSFGGVLLAHPTISAGKLLGLISDEARGDISRRTIGRIRNDVEREYDSAPLVLTAAQERARLEFVGELLPRLDSFGEIIFSDSAYFPLRGQRGAASPLSGLNVWGAIGRGYKSPLLVYRGRFNGERYRQALASSGLFGRCRALFGEGWTFQQDNERAQVSRGTLSWLQAQDVRWLPGWPTKAADLSVIEYVWPMLRHALAARATSSLEELEASLRECWDSLPQAECLDPLVASFRSLLEAVESAGGGAISCPRTGPAPGMRHWLAVGEAVIVAVHLRGDGPSTVEIQRLGGGETLLASYPSVMQHPMLNGLVQAFLQAQMRA
jgi:hypothetical protein